MIFSCGPGAAGRKKQIEYLEDWHPFFALWPRVVNDRGIKQVCAWLQTIERKCTWRSGYDGGYLEKEYRLTKKVARACGGYLEKEYRLTKKESA